MTTYNGLPLYRVALAEDDGVLRVSLVENPAVESDFEVFRKEEAKRPALYSVQDEDKHLVRGVILRADYPIYRNDGRGGYYVTFGADVIREAAERYIAAGRANAVDTDHDGKEVDGVQMVQLFIKDAAAGVAPEGFDDIADGSLFGEYHVTDPDIWDEIKAGTWKGFSVEIFYKLIPAADFTAEKENKFPAYMKKLFSAINAAIVRVFAEFGSVTTDKGVIDWDGDEDLKAGDRVEVEDAEGNRSAAADGDYTTPDGKVIVIVDGAVAEVKDPEAEVAPEGEEPEKAEDGKSAEESPEQMAKARAAEFTASYSEKMQAIHDAVQAALSGENYCYVVDAGDDFALVEEYGEATDWRDKLYRYAVRWEGETPVVSDKRAAKYAAVPDELDTETLWNGAPAEDKEAELTAARNEAETYKAEAETLKARIAELEKTPAAEPAQEQFKNEGKEGNADGLVIRDKGLARLARINR